MKSRQIFSDHGSTALSLMDLRYSSGTIKNEEALAKKIANLLLDKASSVFLDDAVVTPVQSSLKKICVVSINMKAIQVPLLSKKDLDKVEPLVREACNKRAYKGLHKILCCCKRSLLKSLFKELRCDVGIVHQFLLDHGKSAAELPELPQIDSFGCRIKQQDTASSTDSDVAFDQLDTAIELGDELAIDEIFQNKAALPLDKVKKSYEDLLVTAVKKGNIAVLKKLLEKKEFLPLSLRRPLTSPWSLCNPAAMALLLDYGANLEDTIEDCGGHFKNDIHKFLWTIKIAAFPPDEPTMRIFSLLQGLGLTPTDAVLQAYWGNEFNLAMVEKLLELGADAEQLLARITDRKAFDTLAPLFLKYCPNPTEKTIRALFAIEDISCSPLYPVLLAHIKEAALASFLPPINDSSSRIHYYFPDHIDLAMTRLNSLSTDTEAGRTELLAWVQHSKLTIGLSK